MNDVKYLNVDLEIDSAADLTPIVEAFGADVDVMFNGDWGRHHRAAFEIGGSHASANEDIEFFCTLIEALSDGARALWNGSFSRTFDLGFESGDTSPSYRLVLAAETIERVSKIGGSLAVTIYPSGSRRRS